MKSSRRLVCAVMSLSMMSSLYALRAAQSAPSASQDTNAKIWIGRYQEIEEYLRTAECVSIERLPPVRCTLPQGGPVARLAWLALPPGVYRGFFTSYKTQIAGYELDRLLKMDMVPPTVERQLQGNTGAATLWVEHVETWKGDAPPAGVNRAEFDRQVTRMRMFDALIGNRDRNQGNVLRDGAWNLILLDHTRAFGPATETTPLPGRIDKDFWARVLALTRKELDARLRPWLDEDQITAILVRRDRMKIEIDKLSR